MMNKKRLNIIVTFFALLPLLINGCMKESNTSVVPEFTNSAELLVYIELNRNVMALENYSPEINVDEVYSNKSNLLLVDIREKASFTAGHIEGAKNVLPKDLLSFLKATDLTPYQKIVIVGTTGQDGAYVTCLLRLAGFENVYCLDYGMGYWNKAFSEPWVQGKSYYGNKYFNQFSYVKNSFSALPEVSYSNRNTIEEKVDSRINVCLEKGYDAIKTNMKDTYANYFDYSSNSFSGCYVVCYGPEFLYSGPFGYYGLLGHPSSSVLYNPLTDFKSTSYLQTIPASIPIIIYSLNGQQGAYLAAYLQFLGYDARNIDFGGWALWGKSYYIRSIMPGVKLPIDYYLNEFTPYGYWLADKGNLHLSLVRDYPYIIGE